MQSKNIRRNSKVDNLHFLITSKVVSRVQTNAKFKYYAYCTKLSCWIIGQISVWSPIHCYVCVGQRVIRSIRPFQELHGARSQLEQWLAVLGVYSHGALWLEAEGLCVDACLSWGALVCSHAEPC